jgi:hypothetical protein
MLRAIVVPDPPKCQNRSGGSTSFKTIEICFGISIETMYILTALYVQLILDVEKIRLALLYL